MDQPDAAQAVELVRALRDHLHKMNYQLTWLEHHTDSRAAAQLDVAALRRDIDEARRHVDRLQPPPVIADHGIATRRW